jgi:hypothetical protein
MKRSLWALPLISVLCWYCAYLLFQQSQQPLNSASTATAWSKEDSSQAQTKRQADAPWPDHRSANLIYFIQISDIHVSVFKKKGSQHHLREFLKSTLPMVDPAFVIVTGDLTDAKDGWKMSSQQYKEEWTTYYNLLNESGVLNRKGFWWDQRGNHGRSRLGDVVPDFYFS